MKTIYLILRYLFAATMVVWYAGCTGSPVAGGSTDTESGGIVAGVIVDSNGKPAEGAIVQFVPTRYNPVETGAERIILIDTTDTEGRYRIDKIPDSSFNLAAWHPASGTRLCALARKIELSAMGSYSDTLHPSTSLTVPFGAIDTAAGYLYFEGTPYYSTAVNTGTGHVIIDSLPVGVLPMLYYRVKGDTLYENPLARGMVLTEAAPIAIDTQFLYHSNRLTGASTVDGNLSEFDTSGTASLIYQNEGGRFAIVYDDTAMYVGIRVVDRYLQSKRDLTTDPIWNDDAISLLIDTDNNGGAAKLPGDFVVTVNIRGICGKMAGPGGHVADSAIKCIAALDGTLNSDADRDESFVIEMSIPWSSLGMDAPPRSGRFGFDVILHDADKQIPATHYPWANVNGGKFTEPDGWGKIVFR